MTKTLSQVRQMVGELGYFAPIHQTLADWISFKALQPVFVMREESRVAAGWLSSYLRSEPASVFLSTLAGFCLSSSLIFIIERLRFYRAKPFFIIEQTHFYRAKPFFHIERLRFYRAALFFLPLSKILVKTRRSR